MEETLIRRVYCGELARAMGFSTKWLLELERRGVIPPGRRDPGGRRKFWPSDIAQGLIAGRAPEPEKRAETA